MLTVLRFIAIPLLIAAAPPAAGPVKIDVDGPGQVDFIYYQGQEPESIEVPFGLGGSCSDAGAFASVLEGVLIEEVQADSVRIQPSTGVVFSHDEMVITVKHPGPSFQYRMPITDLRRQETKTGRSVHFLLDGKAPLPKRLEITYRIRCADGALSGLFKTRGAKLTVPTASKGK